MTLETRKAEPVSWFCLRSEAKREHVAAANLRERVSIEVFSPRIRVGYTSRRGATVNNTEALFPGYLFARFIYGTQLRHVVSTTGVTGIVTFGGHAPTVADEIIAHLQREVAAAERVPAAPALAAGEWVRILAGCFQYLDGQVVHFDPRAERVRLLLHLLGSEVQVSVSLRQVAPVAPARAYYPSGLLIDSPAVVACPAV